MGGVYISIDVFGHKTVLEKDAFDLFNASSSFISQFACGIYPMSSKTRRNLHSNNWKNLQLIKLVAII